MTEQMGEKPKVTTLDALKEMVKVFGDMVMPSERDLAALQQARRAIAAAEAEPRFTPEEILKLSEAAIYMTAVDRGHGPEPPMVTAEIEQFKGNLRKILQDTLR